MHMGHNLVVSQVNRP